jgi:hypothetical protein
MIFESRLFCFNFRKEQHYIVPVEDAPMYLAHGFKLGMPPASSDPNKIYVTFWIGSKFTEEDVRNYFRYHHLTLVPDASSHEASPVM